MHILKILESLKNDCHFNWLVLVCCASAKVCWASIWNWILKCRARMLTSAIFGWPESHWEGEQWDPSSYNWRLAKSVIWKVKKTYKQEHEYNSYSGDRGHLSDHWVFRYKGHGMKKSILFRCPIIAIAKIPDFLVH